MDLKEVEGRILEYGDLVVVPFPTVDHMAYAYLRMKEEDTINLIFYEEIPNLQTYLSYFTREGVTVFGAFRKKDGGRVEMLGIGRIDEPRSMGGGYSKSEITVGFFREFWSRQWTMPCCKMMIEWTFRFTTVDVLFGTTPEKNKAMIRFAKTLGYDLNYLPNYTTWKGEMCGVWVSSMTEDQWKSRSPFNGI